MKTILRIIFVTFILSNFSFNTIAQSEQNKLIPIPTEPHNNPIEVFYKGEKPTKKYYQIAILEAYRSVSHTYADIVNDLKIQAQKSGMDAIIISELRLTTTSGIDSEGYSSLVSAKEGIAYGIKYEIDFSYLQYYPKTEMIYGYNVNSETYDSAGFLKYDLSNNVIEYSCSKSLFEFQYKYSLQKLMSETEGWKSYETDGVVVRRVYRNNEITCRYKYDGEGRVTTIKIRYQELTHNATITHEHKVVLFYDESGRLHKKKIYLKPKDENTYYVEIFRYDELNRLSEKQLLLQFKDDLKPMTKSFITEYYSEKDLKALYPELKLRG